MSLEVLLRTNGVVSDRFIYIFVVWIIKLLLFSTCALFLYDLTRQIDFKIRFLFQIKHNLIYINMINTICKQ